MSPKMRREILKNHAQENEEIAKRFFSDIDGKLFSDEGIDVPFKQYHATEFEEAIIKLFSLVVNKQELNLAFLNSMQHRRTLACFGGGQVFKRFMQRGALKPDVVIDNNLSATTVEGVPVVAASSITNWSNYHIIITTTHHEDISKQLQNVGLREGRDYIKWYDLIETRIYDKVYFGFGAFEKLENV